MRFAILSMLVPVLSLCAAAAHAQPAPTRTFVSGTEIASMIAARKTVPLSLSPYQTELEYRTGPQTAMAHPKHAKVIYIVEGRGILIRGGTLDQSKADRAGDLTGTGITGGERLQVEKGAAVIVPENTPYQFVGIEGALADLSFRLPRGSDAPVDAARTRTFASVGDVQAQIAGKKNDMMVGLPPYRSMLQYRVGAQNALLHRDDAEIVYVMEGSGSFTVGGTVNNAKPTRDGNFAGTSITGGTSFKVGKGALIYVPENTAHQFTGVEGLILSANLHIPTGGKHAH